MFALAFVFIISMKSKKDKKSLLELVSDFKKLHLNQTGQLFGIKRTTLEEKSCYEFYLDAKGKNDYGKWWSLFNDCYTDDNDFYQCFNYFYFVDERILQEKSLPDNFYTTLESDCNPNDVRKHFDAADCVGTHENVKDVTSEDENWHENVFHFFMNAIFGKAFKIVNTNFGMLKMKSRSRISWLILVILDLTLHKSYQLKNLLDQLTILLDQLKNLLNQLKIIMKMLNY
jgi:hypothetical protein